MSGVGLVMLGFVVVLSIAFVIGRRRMIVTAYEEALEGYDNPGRGERAQAGLEAREKAVEFAFKGVNFNELEEEWREFILGLKVPK